MRVASLFLALVLAAPLLAPMGDAWFWDCEGDPTKPECANDPDVDPSILYAFGNGGHHSIGLAPGGEGVREYDSCLFAYLEHERDFGQLIIAGIFNPATAVDIRFEDWNNATGPRKGIERDLQLNKGNLGGLPLPELDVYAAGWGNATFEVNFEEYADTVNGPPWSNQEEWNWTATFFLTKNGIRDNGTKRMTNIGGGDFDPDRPRDVRLERDDWEAHLILRNHTSQGNRWQVPFNIRGPELSTVRDDQYRAIHRLPNWAYGGEANVRIEVTAPTLLQTNLRFELLSPADESVGNWTLGGTPLATDTRTFTLPLDELLEYRFRVTGSLAAAQYRIVGTMTGPEEALLYFWWEDFVFGYRAIQGADTCRGVVHGDLMEPAPLVVHTPDPKPLNVPLVLLGIGATLLIALYVVKIAMDSLSTSSFMRTFRKS